MRKPWIRKSGKHGRGSDFEPQVVWAVTDHPKLMMRNVGWLFSGSFRFIKIV